MKKPPTEDVIIGVWMNSQ